MDSKGINLSIYETKTLNRTGRENRIFFFSSNQKTSIVQSKFQLYPCLALKNFIQELLKNNPQLKSEVLPKWKPVQPQPCVGKIKICCLSKEFDSSIKQLSGAEMRQRTGSQFYSDNYAYLTFPPPESFLIFCYTASIYFRNDSDSLAVTLTGYQQTEHGKDPSKGRTWIIQPKEDKVFDIRKDGWLIQIR